MCKYFINDKFCTKYVISEIKEAYFKFEETTLKHYTQWTKKSQYQRIAMKIY